MLNNILFIPDMHLCTFLFNSNIYYAGYVMDDAALYDGKCFT